MREETLIEAVNDIDTIARLTEDLYDKYYNNEPDYWGKLHHQAAIAAMQGILSSDKILGILGMQKEKELDDMIGDMSVKIATTLVNRLKEDKS